MTVTIGSIDFDHVFYDAEGDILYLSVGKPRPAARTHETPAGHAIIRYDAGGAVIGLTFFNAKWLVEQEAPLELDDDDHVVNPDVLVPALA